MKKDIRLFCLTLPGTAPQLGFDYAQALSEKGHRVRVMAIGTTWYGEPPWCEAPEFFTTELSADFINMVCVPPNYLLGNPMKAEDAAAPANLPGYVHPEGERAEGVVYEPQTAFGALFTVGVPNVALTRATPTPEEQEIRNLKQYDEIWVPFERDLEVFAEMGISAIRKGPTEI